MTLRLRLQHHDDHLTFAIVAHVPLPIIRWRRWLLRYILIPVVLALILCEVGLWLAIGSFNPPPRFAPLSSMSYDLDEQGFWRARDFHSADLNVTANERLTTNRPGHYTRQVWLFGSSTVWGLFVPDRETIASALQREFNRHGTPWRVRNMGQSNYDVASELYWLKQAAIQPGDVIISLDGALDYLNMMRAAKKHWAASQLPCLLERVPLKLLSLWCESVTYGRIPGEYLKPALQTGFARFWNGQRQLTQYAHAHRAIYLHVLQPPNPEIFDGEYYSLLGANSLQTFIAGEDYQDGGHYDLEGNTAVARQIAALFGAF